MDKHIQLITDEQRKELRSDSHRLYRITFCENHLENAVALTRIYLKDLNPLMREAAEDEIAYAVGIIRYVVNDTAFPIDKGPIVDRVAEVIEGLNSPELEKASHAFVEEFIRGTLDDVLPALREEITQHHATLELAHS